MTEVQPGEADHEAIRQLILEQPWAYQRTGKFDHQPGRMLAMTVCAEDVALDNPPGTCVLSLHLEQAPGDVPICRMSLSHAPAQAPALECEFELAAGESAYRLHAEIMPDGPLTAYNVAESAEMIAIIQRSDLVEISLPIDNNDVRTFSFRTYGLHWPPREEDL